MTPCDALFQAMRQTEKQWEGDFEITSVQFEGFLVRGRDLRFKHQWMFETTPSNSVILCNFQLMDQHVIQEEKRVKL